MGKVTDKGSAPADSDLFSGGLTWSFHRESKKSTDDGSSDSSNPAPEVRKQTQDEDTLRDDDPNQREIVTEEDDLRAGAIRRLKVLRLNKGRRDQTQG
ncbi:MAG: hypothetical protein ACK5AC_04725 [Planctomycetota bacterium]|jgi:hypothetical protein